MVSQAKASVDAWLERAEEVLQAQQEHGISPSSVPWDDEREEWALPLASFEAALEDLLERLCRRPGRWILIAEDNVHRHHFWQALAFEDGSLVTETVSNFYLEGEDRWAPEREHRLLALGWEPPRLPKRSNWIDVQYTTSPPVDEVARLASTTLKEVFGLGASDDVYVKLFSSPIRGDTPAACLADAGRDERTPTTDRSARPVFSRPPNTEAELDAWAESFVNAVLCEPTRHAEAD